MNYLGVWEPKCLIILGCFGLIHVVWKILPCCTTVNVLSVIELRLDLGIVLSYENLKKCISMTVLQIPFHRAVHICMWVYTLPFSNSVDGNREFCKWGIWVSNRIWSNRCLFPFPPKVPPSDPCAITLIYIFFYLRLAWTNVHESSANAMRCKQGQQ